MSSIVRKVFVSGDITKGDVKRYNLNSIKELRNYILAIDTEPRLGKEYPSFEKDKADEYFKSVAEAYIIPEPFGAHLYVGFSCIEEIKEENYESLTFGSDYTDFCEFDETSLETIKEFCGIKDEDT